MASPTLGPITKVPYEILTEIFVHCLPQRRLEHRQPNTSIAPILLCHVCSTWRTVAMATATLWSHLSCRLAVDTEGNGYADGNWILRKNQYAFLLWWKNNQHSMAPSLCLDLVWHSEAVASEPAVDSKVKLDGGGMILFEYISSAKYLETNDFFWFVVGIYECPIAYPVPHTLVVSNWLEHFDFFYKDQLALVPNHSPSALRHLYLSGEIHFHDIQIPKHWSLLTHLALLVSTMSLDYWYSLIRAVPHLQLGHFQIEVLDDDNYTEPTPCTLAQLSTFSITVCQMHGNSESEIPFHILFAALHLPALRHLSLSSGEAWHDHHALDHIYSVLDSAPAITTLTLRSLLLILEVADEYLTEIHPLIVNTEPVWRRAPNLLHLRLVAEDPYGMFEKCAEERRDTLFRNLFHRGRRWLALNDAACPIQSVTIIDRQPSHPEANMIADYTRSCIQEYAGGSPDVKAVIDVIFETQDQAIAGAWNEWGPNLQ